MIIKKFIFVLMFFAITSCGYSPIYSSKKETLNLSINNIELKGNKDVNRKIVSLANLVEKNNKSYAYNLILDSNKKIEIVARDNSGNASIYKITVITDIYLKDPNNEDEILEKVKILAPVFPITT